MGIRPGQHGSRLFERQAALEELTRVLAAAGNGDGRALFFVGLAGMGKTALIEAAREMAVEAGLVVLSSRGAAMEGDFAFAFAGQFLGVPASGGPGSGDPGGQEAGGDPLSRRAAVHDLARTQLRQWAMSDPLAVLLDDMHWADPDSVSLVAFLARRLAGLPVALIGALRPWPAGPVSMVRSLAHEGAVAVADVPALSLGATGELISELTGAAADPALVGRAFGLAKGNPLLVREIARSIAREGGLPETGIADPAQLQRALLLSHLAGLPPQALECARAAAILGGRVRVAVVQAVTGQPADVFAVGFDALIESGVLRPSGQGWAEFSHELLAATLRDDMAPAQRRLLHMRAFGHYAGVDDVAAAAPHALAADLSGDERAVTVVAEAGVRALTQGAVQVALAQLAAAVELAGPAASAGLLVRQADALLAAGRMWDALAAYQRLLARSSRPLSPEMASDVRAKMARALAYTGRLDEALAVYDDLVRDPGTPASALVPFWLERAHVIWQKDGPGGALAALEDAEPPADSRLSPGTPRLSEPPVPSGFPALSGPLGPIGLVRSYFRLQAGDPAGLEDLKRGAALAAQRAVGSPGQALPSFNAFPFYASACAMTERYEEGLQLTDQAVEWLRSAGALWSAIPLRINRLGFLLCQGFPLAVVAGAEDVEEEFELDELTRPTLLVVKARGLAWLGRADEATAICDAVQRMPGGQSWFAALTLTAVRGECLLAQGRPAEAADTFAEVERLVSRFGVGEPCGPVWADGAVEAALAAGRLGQAGRVVAWLESRDPALPCRWPRMAALAGRAGIAAASGDGETADRLYREALAVPSARPLDRARVQLWYGTWLRRSQQPVRARAVLAEALHMAEERGAALMAGQAHAELSAAGGRRRRQHPAGELTAQESRVVRLAITGATTREMAGEMSVSVRTIESHLARAYRKLGVGSKAELRQRRAELELGG